MFINKLYLLVLLFFCQSFKERFIKSQDKNLNNRRNIHIKFTRHFNISIHHSHAIQKLLITKYNLKVLNQSR